MRKICASSDLLPWLNTVFQSDDELDILEALIESNRQRTKDNEQVGREADALMGIEKERAKRRQQEHAKTAPGKKKETLQESFPEVKKKPQSQARDTVGEKVGTSGKTAEQSAFCVRVIDALQRIGKILEAHQLRQLLFQSQDALVLSNRDTRQRTPEQEGREYLTLKDIASRRAGKSKGGRPADETKEQEQKPTVISPQVCPPPKKRAPLSGDIAAKQLNISRQKGERAAFAVQTMDKLEAGGKKVEAHQIRQLLRKNVGKAYRLARPASRQRFASGTGTAHWWRSSFR